METLSHPRVVMGVDKTVAGYVAQRVAVAQATPWPGAFATRAT